MLLFELALALVQLISEMHSQCLAEIGIAMGNHNVFELLGDGCIDSGHVCDE